MSELEIAEADPRIADVRDLIGRQRQFGQAHSPPEDAHALDADELLDPAIVLFAARRGGELLGIGALKRLDDRHGELKTMHTAAHARGQGVGRALLEHLLGVARERGFARVSLETGTMDAFAPARALYVSAGFRPCDPFGDYRPSVNSAYLSLTIVSAGS